MLLLCERSVLKNTSFLSETGTGSKIAIVDVKDGRIVRIRPFHRPKTEDYVFWQIRARGKTFCLPLKVLLPPFSLAYRQRVYSPNRVRYPLKRVDWDPDGDRHPENRGKSGYVRISWEEALNIIAKEIRRIVDHYGPEAILLQADGHGETKIVHAAHELPALLLNELGGYTAQTRNADSWEGWYWGAKHVWGIDPTGLIPQGNVIDDVAEHSELLLFWGADPETTPWAFQGQLSSLLCFWLRKEIGIKMIFICPNLNYAAAVHADKWIPIRPNTDAALQLAIAYVWITNGTYDKKYVETHTYGFEEFKKYVLGEVDGVPKTPKWAERITGVPARTIKALAREWAAKRTTIVHCMGGGYIRGPYSHEPARLEALLLAMQGVGKPGVHQLLLGVESVPPAGEIIPNPMAVYRGTAIPPLVAAIKKINRQRLYKEYSLVSWTPPPFGAPKKGAPKQIIPKTLIPEAILNPPISWFGTTLWAEPLEDQFKKYTYPAEGCSEIRMIWTDSPCWTTCWNNGFKLIEAIRSPKIEFVLAQHPWLENDCLFADIILPVSTKFEQDDIGVDITGGGPFMMVLEEKAIEPLGESKSDYEIVCLIAEKLGLLDKVTNGLSINDWIKAAFDSSGISKFMSWEGFKERKYFIAPSDPTSKQLPPGLRRFYEAPEIYPLKTPSGKIEFYSQNLAKRFPDDKERPPVPQWISYGETHQESLEHLRAKRFPLLMVTPHGRWRVHAQLDDVAWFHEIPTCKIRGPDGYLYEPVWIHPHDAEKRGIKHGDIVKVYNERGAVLAGAYVTERIMPRVVLMDHGARVDLIDDKLDRGGAINLIAPHKTTSKNATGMAVSGFLVEVEKANLHELMEKYPEAFKRPYNLEFGLCLERALIPK